VIILGVVLLALAVQFELSFLWALGMIVTALGLVLMLVGSMGLTLAGRRHYW
jgi:hypothetical protein